MHLHALPDGAMERLNDEQKAYIYSSTYLFSARSQKYWRCELTCQMGMNTRNSVFGAEGDKRIKPPKISLIFIVVVRF